MKNLLILIVLFAAGCSSETIEFNKLNERDSLFYKVNSDTPYSGKIFANYENGQKKSEGYLKDGQLDGLHIHWYENGQKKFEGNFKYGIEEGLHIGWFEDGQKRFEANFKHGSEEGLHFTWTDNGRAIIHGLEGTVSVHGSPAKEHIQITFHPIGEGQQPAAGLTDGNGKYSLFTGKTGTPGVMAGKYKILARDADAVDESYMDQTEDNVDSASGSESSTPKVGGAIPEKYSSAETSDHEVEITSSTTTLDIDLK